MRQTSDNEILAIVGSPSTNAELVLNLTAAAYDTGLVGALVYIQPGLGEGEELALGTVNQVVTKNQWHENSSLQGVIKTTGSIPGLTAEGDVRTAEVRLQATYQRPRKTGPWEKGGPTLSMSPTTGTNVRRATDEMLQALLTDTERESIAYLGSVYRNNHIRLPTNMRDFADDRGAVHTGIFGTTGAGKTAIASLLLGCQLRHSAMAVLLIDPQGQFSSDAKTLIPLQALARLTGRDVEVLRISHDLQLSPNPALLCDFLRKTEFFKELDMGHSETMGNVSRLIRNLLQSKIPRWYEKSADELLREILDHLAEESSIKRIIKSPERRQEIGEALGQTLDQSGYAWKKVLSHFRPLHSVFSKKNLDGGRRRNLFGVLKHLMEPSIDNRAPRPRPYVVLNMSRSGGDDEYGVLDDDDLKAEILLTVANALTTAAEQSYQDDKPLNSLVLFDEAHRYAPPVSRNDEGSIVDLSKALAKAARETRKYGVGWTYITQNINSLHPAIFDMLGVRVCGYGFGASDLRAMEEHVDSRNSLDLYRTFANPDQTKKYPYMITGPFSPLSFTKAPIFVESFDPDRWLEENAAWITEKARSAGRSMPSTLTVAALQAPSTSQRPDGPRSQFERPQRGRLAPQADDRSGPSVRSSLDRRSPQ
jgi:uncharacterized protein DUF87